MKEEHPAPDTLVRDVVIVVAVILAVYISNNITPLSVDTVVSGEAPTNIFSFIVSKIPFGAIRNFFQSIQVELVALGILFVVGVFWIAMRKKEIHHKVHEQYKPVQTAETEAAEKTINWEIVLGHLNSENPAEWKIAILEADNILDEVLEDMGYAGETVAEKLKGMSRTKIASYDDVWEAHKLRNKIAHGETLGEELTRKTARDTIAKFENAFKELGYL